MEEMKKIQVEPFIKDIYDPLTGSHDGTITPSAPIVVTGENLRLCSPGNVILSLSLRDDKDSLIRFKEVYKYTDTKLLAILPQLKPGTYSPVLQMHRDGEKIFSYVFPVEWKVPFEGASDYLTRYFRNQLA